jgi:predicted HicB family RNase H-like nuclease
MMKFSIRLSEADHLKVKYQAKKQSISVAQYIRNLIDNDK